MLSGAISESSGGYARREVLKRLSVCFFSASPGRKEGGRLIAYSGCSSSPALISAVAHADPGSGWAIPYRTGSFTGLLAVLRAKFLPFALGWPFSDLAGAPGCAAKGSVGREARDLSIGAPPNRGCRSPQPAVPGSACSACRQVLELEAQLHQLSPCTHYYEGL